MEIKAIDLSHHNGNVDFRKVKASGISTIIIRTGFGFYSPKQIDKKFYEYYDAAKNLGFNIGAYHYSYADGPISAEKEAQAMLKIIGDRKFELPLFIDIEERVHYNMSKKLCSESIAAFCNYLEGEKYWAGVYSFDSLFATHITGDICQRYTTWVARVENVKPKSCPRYDIWQNSHRGRVDGCIGNVDLDIVYKDFPPIVKRAHLNGY